MTTEERDASDLEIYQLYAELAELDMLEINLIPREFRKAAIELRIQHLQQQMAMD